MWPANQLLVYGYIGYWFLNGVWADIVGSENRSDWFGPCYMHIGKDTFSFYGRLSYASYLIKCWSNICLKYRAFSKWVECFILFDWATCLCYPIMRLPTKSHQKLTCYRLYSPVYVKRCILNPKTDRVWWIKFGWSLSCGNRILL